MRYKARGTGMASYSTVVLYSTYEIRSTDHLLGATVRSTEVPTTVLYCTVRVLELVRVY